MPFWLKILVTVSLILLISEVSKRSEQIGALITALPWITILSLLWLYLEGRPTEKIAEYSGFTFWYVIPTLPMFLIIPRLLSAGLNFWVSLTLGISSAIVCLLAVAPVALRFGFKII